MEKDLRMCLSGKSALEKRAHRGKIAVKNEKRILVILYKVQKHWI